MTLAATLFGYVLGLPWGVVLAVTDADGIKPNRPVYRVLDFVTNIMRSIPFLILLILIIPLTRLIVGKSYGSTATIVPLVVSAAPFIARMVESSLKEVDKGVIEAAQSMGADNSGENSNQYLFEEDDISDYDGIKSNISEEKEEDESNDFSKFNFDSEQTYKTKELSNTVSEKIEKIPTTFEWDKGGNTVYVTGSFCNWKQYFLMKKENNNHFYLTLDLPKGFHQYKFRVDDEWKYNEKFPTFDDGGFINNYLDTTNWEITINKNDEGTTINSTNNTDNNDLSKLSKMFKEKSQNSAYFKMKRFSNYIPNKDELSEKIPEIPNHYKNNMNINLFTHQNNIGNSNFLKISENNIMSDNIAFKGIANIYHEQTNHLRTNNNKKKKDKNDDDEKTILCSISSRYRLKFTTFVYYNIQKNENKHFNLGI